MRLCRTAGWKWTAKRDHYVSVTSVRTEYNLITRAENADITKGTKIFLQ